jgi:diguanylate cyclase (GGDEF)-like protein
MMLALPRWKLRLFAPASAGDSRRVCVGPGGPERDGCLPPHGMRQATRGGVQDVGNGGETMGRGVTAFVSYTHDSVAHCENVLALAQRLRADGVSCSADLFVTGSPPEGWPLWMERQLQESDFVLVVCSAGYRRRYDLRVQPKTGLGGTYEALLTRQMLYEAQGRNARIIPVLFEVSSVSCIPLPLRAAAHYQLFAQYEDLLRYLTHQPRVVPEPVGPVPRLPTASGGREVMPLLHLPRTANLLDRKAGESFLRIGLPQVLRKDHLGQSSPLTLLIFDIDNLTQINKHYGKTVGDEVLATIAAVGARFHSQGMVGRCGDDTFFCVLPHLPLKDAARAADELRFQVENQRWVDLAPGLRVTCSVGVAEFRWTGERGSYTGPGARRLRRAAEETVVRAAIGMRGAKADGGNRVRTGPKYFPVGQSVTFAHYWS